MVLQENFSPELALAYYLSLTDPYFNDYSEAVPTEEETGTFLEVGCGYFFGETRFKLGRTATMNGLVLPDEQRLVVLTVKDQIRSKTRRSVTQPFGAVTPTGFYLRGDNKNPDKEEKLFGIIEAAPHIVRQPE